MDKRRAADPKPIISPETADAVRRIAETVAKAREGAPPADRRLSRLIGLLTLETVVPTRDVWHPVLHEMIVGTARGLARRGFTPCFVSGDGLVESGSDRACAFGEHELDGVIVVGPVWDGVAAQVRRGYRRVIWADGHEWGPHRCLRRNEYEAARLVTQHAIDGGYTRLVAITETLEANAHYSHSERLAAIQDVAEREGIELDLIDIMNDSDPSVMDALWDLIGPETTVICADYYRLQVFLGRTLLSPLRPGVDFGLACCDDADRQHKYFAGVTRSSFNRYDIGLRAARMMIDLIHDPQRECPSFILEPELIVGETCPGVGRRR